MKNTTAFLFLFLLTLETAAQEPGVLKLGRENGWKDFTQLSGIGFQKNREGFLEMTLSPGNYSAQNETDLLVHFDHGKLEDEASRYTGAAPQGTLTRELAVMGDGCAVFRGENPVLLEPADPEALFAPGKVWQDFTIEFWLYPAQAQDGETVFKWQGLRDSSGRFETQAVQATFVGSRLVWTFQNLFAPQPKSPAVTLKVPGASPLIPRQWHHHLIRFQAKTGLLEYLLDGQTEALVHATVSGQEEGRVLGAVIGRSARGQILIGSRYTGALDELRISQSFIEEPRQERYSPGSGTVKDPQGKDRAARGTAVSRVIDLKQPGTSLDKIIVRANKEGESLAVYYYRMADSIRYQWSLDGDTKKSLAPTEESEEDSWQPLPPGKPLSAEAWKNGVRGKRPAGRYLQLRVDLLPSGTGSDTPRISQMEIRYIPNLPPPAPAGVEVIPGNGQLTLNWKPVTQGQVDGYMVFRGVKPGQYTEVTDVGNVTSFTIPDLVNDQIYYLCVASYQTIPQPGTPPSEIKNNSVNSREVSARPQRTLP